MDSFGVISETLCYYCGAMCLKFEREAKGTEYDALRLDIPFTFIDIGFLAEIATRLGRLIKTRRFG